MKIKVIKNIGEESANCFGNPGNIHDVQSCYSFTDLTGYEWQSLSGDFDDIDGINKYFGKLSVYNTHFELV